MNIVDAFRSGKNVRRKAWDAAFFNPAAGGDEITLSSADIVANDWEVEEKTVTLTISDLSKAYDEAGDLFSRREECRSFRDALFTVLFSNEAKQG